MEITLGARPVSNDCKGFIHGVDDEFDDDELNDGLVGVSK